MQVAAVATCVSLIARGVASLPIDVIERVDERTRRVAEGHPVRRVLSQPNSWQTSFEWISMQVAHVLLRGNSYSLIARSRGTSDGSEQIVELLPLHPDQVAVEQQPYPSTAVTYTWTSARTGQTYRIPASEMLHFQNLSTNGLVGRSVLEDARDTFGVALATQQHAASFWAHSGLPTVVLTHPKSLGPDAKTSLETHFAETYGGGPDKRRVAVLEEGMALQTLSVTAEDAQFLETRKFQRGEIAGLFHVPPHMIGDTEKSTSYGVGIEQQQIGYVTHALLPLIVSMEQRMGRSLLVNRDRFAIKFYPQALMRGDTKARGAFYRVMREIGAYSANDIRRLEDENPIDGGDTYLQPVNLAPLGSNPLDDEKGDA